MVHEKNWRVSLCVQELSSTRFSLNSCSRSRISEQNGSHRSFVVIVFIWFWIFLVGLGNGSSRSFRSTWSLDTVTGQESIPLRSSFARVSLSLDTVVVCEVDELEEDVG